ncbi:CinA family nicotinamide mononucleotide deamidase-related protein [Elusimicrobiota bacterium]
MSARCEVINVGNELLVNKESQSISEVKKSLSSIGLKVSRITTVGDNEKELLDTLGEVVSRSDIVIVVGGMGSTHDDITRKTVAAFFKKELRFSREAMEDVARYFARRGVDIPGCCDNQAQIIEGSRILKNSQGSSPGQLIMSDDGKIMALLPGPINEVRYILNNELISFLKEKYERSIKKSLIIHFSNICETDVYNKLKEIIDTEQQLEKGDIEFVLESDEGNTDLVIDCWWDNEMLVDEILHKVRSEIYDILSDNIYGENEDTIENVIGRMLTKKRKTLSVAESCTGGLLASIITDSPGSSIYFKQGIITYSNQAKSDQLGIDKKILKEHGAVSSKTAVLMADNYKKISGADYTLSVTGYAGSADSEKNAPGTGYIGISAENGTNVEIVRFSGSRKDIKRKFAFHALDLLWRNLRDQ